jgi:hypothetical protein
MWEGAFNKSSDEYLEDIAKHIESKGYDRVILTTLEYSGGFTYWKHLWDVEEEWSYAWGDPQEDVEWYADNEIDLSDIIPASGHGWAYCYQWIKDLEGQDIHLAGGHRHQCLADLQDTFRHLNIAYTDINELIYG